MEKDGLVWWCCRARGVTPSGETVVFYRHSVTPSSNRLDITEAEWPAFGLGLSCGVPRDSGSRRVGLNVVQALVQAARFRVTSSDSSAG